MLILDRTFLTCGEVHILLQDGTPMNVFMPILDVPLDLPFVRNVLKLDLKSAAEAYNKEINKSVRIGPQKTSRFSWPNIYDLIEYIIIKSAGEFVMDSSCEVIASCIVDDLANYRDFLSERFVSSHVFNSDPSGLALALEAFEDVVLQALYIGECRTKSVKFSSALCEKIRNCVTQFNDYLVKLLTIDELMLS